MLLFQFNIFNIRGYNSCFTQSSCNFVSMTVNEWQNINHLALQGTYRWTFF